MSSMVSTVLEIEREADALLKKAADDALQTVAEARKQREAATDAAAGKLRTALQEIETKAKADREKKLLELTSAGEDALFAVRNVHDDAFDAGVQHIMKALAGD